MGQGKENARVFLKDNPDLANELQKRIKETMGIGAQVDLPADDREEAADVVEDVTDAAPPARSTL